MNNKIAIVTGGSRGLGKSAVLNLANKGVDTILTYHNKQTEAEAVVAQVQTLGQKAIAVQLDTGNSESFGDFVAQVKKALQQNWQRDNFDFLVNNAGSGVYNSFAETTEEEFNQVMNIHFKGVFFLTQKLLPLIIDGGRIINVSSGLTRFALPGYAAYASMKGGIEVLTTYLAKELGARGIGVNVIAPGAIETDFGRGVVRDDEQLNKFLASQTALGRVGLPDDIGGVIASMLAADNRWINAQRIEASGGMFL